MNYIPETAPDIQALVQALSGDGGQKPPEQPEQALQGQPEEPAPPTRAQQIMQELQQLMGGELPGSGLLFPSFTDENTKLEPIDVENVRDWLLRAIKRAAARSMQPYGIGQEKYEESATAALRFSQAWVLLSSELDQNGIPLQHHVELSQAAQALKEREKPQEETLHHSRGQNPLPQPRIS